MFEHDQENLSVNAALGIMITCCMLYSSDCVDAIFEAGMKGELDLFDPDQIESFASKHKAEHN